jgi:hypothetical protein
MNKPLVLQERIGRHQPGSHLLQVKHPLFCPEQLFPQVQGICCAGRFFKPNFPSEC